MPKNPPPATERQAILEQVGKLLDGQQHLKTLDEARYQYRKMIRSRIECAPPELFNPKNDFYSEGDEHAPFFSEGFLYTLIGKEDARSVLAWVHGLGEALGLSTDAVYGYDDFEYRPKTDSSFGDEPWWWNEIWNTERPSTHVFTHPITGEELPINDEDARSKFAMGLLERALQGKGKHSTRMKYLQAIHFIRAFPVSDAVDEELKRVQEKLRGDKVDVSWQA